MTAMQLACFNIGLRITPMFLQIYSFTFWRLFGCLFWPPLYRFLQVKKNSWNWFTKKFREIIFFWKFPAGVLIPSFKIGAALGRMVGEGMNLWFPGGFTYDNQIRCVIRNINIYLLWYISLIFWVFQYPNLS